MFYEWFSVVNISCACFVTCSSRKPSNMCTWVNCSVLVFSVVEQWYTYLLCTGAHVTKGLNYHKHAWPTYTRITYWYRQGPKGVIKRWATQGRGHSFCPSWIITFWANLSISGNVRGFGRLVQLYIIYINVLFLCLYCRYYTVFLIENIHYMFLFIHIRPSSQMIYLKCSQLHLKTKV